MSIDSRNDGLNRPGAVQHSKTITPAHAFSTPLTERRAWGVAPRGIREHVLRDRPRGIGTGTSRGERPAAPARRGGRLGRRRGRRAIRAEPRDDRRDRRARCARRGRRRRAAPSPSRRHRARLAPRGRGMRRVLRVGIRRAGRGRARGRGYTAPPRSVVVPPAEPDVRARIRQPVARAGRRRAQARDEASRGAGVPAGRRDGRTVAWIRRPREKSKSRRDGGDDDDDAELVPVLGDQVVTGESTPRRDDENARRGAVTSARRSRPCVLKDAVTDEQAQAVLDFVCAPRRGRILRAHRRGRGARTPQHAEGPRGVGHRSVLSRTFARARRVRAARLSLCRRRVA